MWTDPEDQVTFQMGPLRDSCHRIVTVKVIRVRAQDEEVGFPGSEIIGTLTASRERLGGGGVGRQEGEWKPILLGGS